MKQTILAAAAAVAVTLTGTIAQAETVRVGIAAEPYPPFTTPDASGEWTGWEVDFMNAVCAEAEFECEIVPVAWDGIIPALTSNKIDAIIGSMSITEERMKTIDFSDKYYNTPAVVVTATGADITPDADGLDGKVLGFQTATIHQAYAAKHFGNVELREYQTQDEANQDLFAGRIDAILADSLALDAFLKSDQGAACCEVAGPVAHDEEVLGAGIGIGLRQDDPKREVFNAAIQTIRDNGTYAAISEPYFDFDIYGE